MVIDTADDLPVEAIRRTLPWRAGEWVSAESLQWGIELLQSLPFLRSAYVELEPSPKGEVLRVRLARQPILRDIHFSGLFPLFENAALDALRMRPGDPFDAAKLARETERLEDLFERRGFFGSACRAVTVPEGGDFTIRYDCDRGKLLRVGEVEVSGASALPAEEVGQELTPRLYFTRERLRKKTEKLVQRYRGLGWVSARIDVEEVRPRPEDGKVDLVVHVKEGKKLVLAFTGNDVADSDDLEEVLTFREEGGYGYFLVEDNERKIEQAYAGKGYPAARAEAEREETEDEVRVTYKIAEGPKLAFEGLRFEGNHSIDHEELEDATVSGRRRWRVLAPRWNVENLGKDQAAIEDVYRSAGFADVAVEPAVQERQDGSVVALFRIREGARYVLGSVRVAGVPEDLEGRVARARRLGAGDPYVQARVQEEASALERVLYAAGLLTGRVDVREERAASGGKVAVTYSLDPGPRYRTSAVFTAGAARTAESVIREAVTLGPGKIITPKALADTQRRLRSLESFESIQVDPVGLYSDQPKPVSGGLVDLPVMIGLRERYRIQIDVGFAYDTDLGATGNASVSNVNLLGRAIQVTAAGKFGDQQRAASLRVTDPMLLGTEFRGSVFGSYRDENLEAFDIRELLVGSALERILSRTMIVKADLSYRVADVSNVTVDDPSAPEEGSSRALLWSASMVRDARNDLLYPSRGSYASVAVTTSARALLSDDNFVRIDLQGRRYQPIAGKLVGVVSARFTDVEIFGSTRRVPTPELLFAGGSTSVRGFEEDRLGPLDRNGDPLGGGARVITNAELRFPLAWILEGALFVDAGKVAQELSDLGKGKIQAAAGAGVRARSPVGPIRLDFGYQLQDNPPLDRWAIHFSFGYPF
ncbi:MAG: BamA/TamA family outer membrane protein [bacterium]